MIYNKGGNNIQWRKDSVKISSSWENWITKHKEKNRTLSNAVYKNKL